MHQLPDPLRAIALQYLNNEDSKWWVRNATASYGTLDVAHLYWIIDSTDHSVTVMQDRNGIFSSLAGAQGLSLSGRLLSKAYGEEPWKVIGLEKFGKTIMSWYSDPRAYLLTEQFFSKQQPVLASWLTQREKDPAALKALCREPVLALAGSSWTLKFNAINRRGGVELWAIRGETAPFAINQVDVAMIKENGTFHFPDEL